MVLFIATIYKPPPPPPAPFLRKKTGKAKATKEIIGRGERERGVQVELRFREGPGAQEVGAGGM